MFSGKKLCAGSSLQVLSNLPVNACTKGNLTGGRKLEWSGKRSRKFAAQPQAALQGATAPRSAVNARSPHKLNVPGDLYVDHTCIDCDTCRWMAPFSFSRPEVAGQSVVFAQPKGAKQKVRAVEALHSCPTNSIHLVTPDPQIMAQAQQNLPSPIPGVPGVLHCGWHDVRAIAAASYLVLRPEGNILVDVPRFNPILQERIKELGGVRWMFLTHQDDVGNHRAWARNFNAVRIIHKNEVTQDTSDVEIKLEGEGPWQIDNELRPVEGSLVDRGGQHQPRSSSDCQIVFTPGHTAGHLCLYHQPSRTIFTGDHLSSPPNVMEPHRLYVFEKYNWFSLGLQLQSVQKLLDLDFLHVLPGHGRMASFNSPMHRLQAVSNLLAEYEGRL